LFNFNKKSECFLAKEGMMAGHKILGTDERGMVVIVTTFPCGLEDIWRERNKPRSLSVLARKPTCNDCRSARLTQQCG